MSEHTYHLQKYAGTSTATPARNADIKENLLIMLMKGMFLLMNRADVATGNVAAII